MNENECESKKIFKREFRTILACLEIISSAKRQSVVVFDTKSLYLN